MIKFCSLVRMIFRALFAANFFMKQFWSEFLFLSFIFISCRTRARSHQWN
uniref:Uncharacterized protein n=1 Tax=Arundo donax TaxID=35708 RepID=A0A0A9H086_ARUDO